MTSETTPSDRRSDPFGLDTIDRVREGHSDNSDF
jgi:hypothetical protein